MGDRASRRGAVDLGLPLMIVAFLAIGGFLYWLNLQAQAELAEKAAIAEEMRQAEAELEAMGDIIQGAALQGDPGVYVGRTVTVQGMQVSSPLGQQGFWISLPNGNPFLVSMSDAVKAEGMSVGTDATVDVTGEIHEMTDSVLDAWSAAASIGEGDRLAAEFATHYLEASRVRLAEGQAGGRQNPGAGGEG